MRSISLRRQRQNRERTLRRAIFIGKPCERCQCQGTDWHEVRTRARGGSITDESNAAWLCRGDHRIITENPDWAVRHGWVLNSWSSDADADEARSVRTAWGDCPVSCEVDHRRMT